MSAALKTHRLTHHEYTPGSWAGGVTRGIWADPPDAIGAPAGARCWAGTATIERDAPYSHFAGLHRLQVVIGGPELRLRFREPEEEVLLARGAQYQFAGARPVHAMPADSSVVAFNLIYRADIIAGATIATVAPGGLLWPLDALAELGVARPRSPVRLIYVLAGALTVEGEAAPLAADDSLLLAPPTAEQPAPLLRLQASGAESAEAILATFWVPREPDA